MDRVELRRPRLEDGPALIAANLQSRDFHHPWAQPFVDEAGFSAWLERNQDPAYVGFIAIERAGGEIVGVVNISNIIRGFFNSAFLGFYGMQATAGRGLMTEAVGGAVRFAFDNLGLHRLEANIQPANEPSKALVKRLNFRLEGFSPRYLKIAGDWRDHERWAIVAD